MQNFDAEKTRKVVRVMSGQQVRRFAGGLIAAKEYATGTPAETAINAAADIAMEEYTKYGWKPR